MNAYPVPNPSGAYAFLRDAVIDEVAHLVSALSLVSQDMMEAAIEASADRLDMALMTASVIEKGLDAS